jgi:hypothetical protein
MSGTSRIFEPRNGILEHELALPLEPPQLQLVWSGCADRRAITSSNLMLDLERGDVRFDLRPFLVRQRVAQGPVLLACGAASDASAA